MVKFNTLNSALWVMFQCYCTMLIRHSGTPDSDLALSPINNLLKNGTDQKWKWLFRSKNCTCVAVFGLKNGRMAHRPKDLNSIQLSSNRKGPKNRMPPKARYIANNHIN